MYRKLASALLVASAISSKYAMAVSLGEVTMLSALNEPLNAEIRLSNTADFDAAQILVALASSAEFEEVGIERTFFHSDIKFSIELDGKGSGVVKLRSERRLNEPFLDFLIDAKWPTGRMLRSYTVLVDLPVYNHSAPVISAAPVPKSPAPVSSAKPATAPVAKSVAATASASAGSRSAAKPASKPSRQVGEGEYRTQRNDTLWVIAQQHNPGGDISVQQTMLAIQQLNPHAFYNGNINRLKAGVVLRMPSSDVIREVSKQSAMESVSQQNRQWKNPQLDTSVSDYPSRPAVVEREGHLRLTSAGISASAAANGELANAAIEEQLIAARDQAAAAQLEKNELNNRVDSLSSQVEQLKRLIELKDAELASLQQQLGKEVAKPVEAVKDVSPTKVEEKAVEQSASTTAVSKPVDAKAPAEKTKAEIKAAPVAPTPVAEPSLVDKVMANPIYIGAVGLLIALGVGGFLLRRRAQAEKQWQEENEQFNFDDNASGDVNYEPESADDNVAALDELEVEADLEGDEDAVLQTGDAIGEADIYIAYNQYGHASSLLKKALQANPADQAVRIKLLEVFVLAGNKEAFVDVFEELQARGNRAEVDAVKEALSANDQAVEWLEEVSESSFAVPEAQSATAEESSLLDDDFATDINDGFLNDLDLSDDFSFDAVEEEQAKESIALEDALDNSFDLGGELEVDEALSFETMNEESDVSAELDDFSFDLEENVSAPAVEEEGAASDFDLDLSDDLSLELSSFDETQLDVAPAAEEEVLSFDELGLDGEDDSAFTSDLALDADLAVEDESFSFDDLDLSDELTAESTEAQSLADDEPELSLADFDLDFDDIEPEASSVVEPIASAVASDEVSFDGAFDISLDDSSSVEPSVDVVSPSVSAAPIAAAVAPVAAHVSAPIASLGDDDLSFISGSDEVATKLDLAQAYVDLGDVDGAREILLEVLKEGNDEQRTEANSLMSTLD